MLNEMELLREHRDLLEKENLTQLYIFADKECSDDTIPKVTRLLLNAGIDPLDYMKIVPKRYLCGDEDLTEIYIPTNIEIINSMAFAYCRNLKHIKLPDNLREIHDKAFMHVAAETIELPYELDYIGESAFSESPLTNITLPDYCKSIGSYCFSNCYNLKTVVLGEHLELIPDGAFLGCINLESVEIGGRLKGIGRNAFLNCFNLEEIHIHSNVTQIDKNAFAGRYDLTIRCKAGSLAHEYAEINRFKTILY